MAPDILRWLCWFDGGLEMTGDKHATGSRLTALLAAVGFACLSAAVGCTTTSTTARTPSTTTSSTRVAHADSSATQAKKPKHDASGKHRHEHCHIKGNGKNEVCHDHPHDGGTHH
jgi:hypothetical protein